MCSVLFFLVLSINVLHLLKYVVTVVLQDTLKGLIVKSKNQILHYKKFKKLIMLIYIYLSIPLF